MLFTLLFHFLLYCEIEVLLLVICTLQKGTVLFRDVNLPRAAWLVFANSRVRYDEEPWKDAINWHSFCQVTKPGTSVCASPTPPFIPLCTALEQFCVGWPHLWLLVRPDTGFLPQRTACSWVNWSFLVGPSRSLFVRLPFLVVCDSLFLWLLVIHVP